MKLTYAAVIIAAMAGPALAQTAAPAPAAPVGVPVTSLTEGQMRFAREIVEGSGIGRSFDGAIPDIALRIRQNFAVSRPEIVKDMDDTLVALLPEIRSRRGEIIERAARAFAAQFTEAELKEVSTFFNSPIGKKYVTAQPQILNEIFQSMEPWMQQTSEFFLSRFREEMRKKGHTV